MAYAERDTNRALYDLSIKVESTSTSGWKKTVHLEKGKFGVLTTFKVSPCCIVVTVETKFLVSNVGRQKTYDIS